MKQKSTHFLKLVVYVWYLLSEVCVWTQIHKGLLKFFVIPLWLVPWSAHSLFKRTEDEYIPDAESVRQAKEQHLQPQTCSLAQCFQLYTKEEQVGSDMVSCRQQECWEYHWYWIHIWIKEACYDPASRKPWHNIKTERIPSSQELPATKNLQLF